MLLAENYLEFIKLQRGYYSKFGVHAPLIDAGGELYNVKAYGAKGDASTNDTAAIQLTLTTANNAGGGIVYLPPGVYLISPGVGLNVGSNTIIRGSGVGSVLKIPNGANTTGNLVKAQTVSNVTYDNFMIDGNSSGQASGTNYGAYFGDVTNGTISNLYVKNMTGVGIHVYNSTGIKTLNNWSTGNTFHGFEAEQCTACTWQGNRSFSNTLHGIIINPGEVAGTGSQGLSIIGNICDNNSQYGIAVGVANGNTGTYLSKDCVIANNIVRNNTQYGIQLFEQDGFLLSNNEVTGNGYFGIYLFESSNNQIIGNRLHNNSQSSNNSYDEILIEGSSSGHASTNNMIANNSILIDGAIKARYAINEGTSSDGPNIISNNFIPNAGATGRINSLVATDSFASMGTGDVALYRGNGAPTLSAAQGSMYIRTDGSSTSTRLYTNTNGSTGWTSVTTAS